MILICVFHLIHPYDRNLFIYVFAIIVYFKLPKQVVTQKRNLPKQVKENEMYIKNSKYLSFVISN